MQISHISLFLKNLAANSLEPVQCTFDHDCCIDFRDFDTHISIYIIKYNTQLQFQ